MRPPKRIPTLVKLFLTASIAIMVTLLVSEWILRSLYGLGHPVIYQRDAVIGFRPRPDQTVERFGGAVISFNNLALRSRVDWDSNRDNKILFLGDSVTYGGSYIDNSELFSELAVEGWEGFIAGNAGVNGWGVHHIHALVAKTEFMPARIYVTTLIEDDFYRMLAAGSGLWQREPSCALEELVVHWMRAAIKSRQRAEDENALEAHRILAAEDSARQLKHLDETLAARGYPHLIFISPRKCQVLGGEQRDSAVARGLKKHGVEVIYLLDDPRLQSLSRQEVDALYHDKVHLSRHGHRVWAEMMAPYLDRVIE